MVRSQQLDTPVYEDVGSYTTLDGASRAVTCLVEHGFAEGEVSIAPRQFHVVQPRVLRRRISYGWRFGALVGAVTLGLISLVSAAGLSTIVSDIVPMVALGGLIGVVAGVVAAALRHRYVRSRAFADAPRDFQPERYAVHVLGNQEQARHTLAQWWDPTAPPWGRQKSA